MLKGKTATSHHIPSLPAPPLLRRDAHHDTHHDANQHERHHAWNHAQQHGHHHAPSFWQAAPTIRNQSLPAAGCARPSDPGVLALSLSLKISSSSAAHKPNDSA